MRVLFFGSPGYAVPVAGALIATGHQVVGVVTQPDRRAGRGGVVTPTAIKAWAQDRAIPVLQPRSFRPAEAVAHLATMSPDVIVVAAYGRFLPPSVLQMPPRGCLNLHPSLLPRHRGPSPVVETILQMDAVAGVTVMLMDEGMDSGPVLAQEEEPVLPEDTAEGLTWRLFRRGASLMARTLEAWDRGDVHPVPQDHERATFTRLLKREDGAADWRLSAAALAAKARAYHPWPGIHTQWDGRTVKLLEVSAPPTVGLGSASGGPGLVVRLPDGPAPVGVVTGDGVLGVQMLQMEGRRPVDALDFLRGYPTFVGATLTS